MGITRTLLAASISAALVACGGGGSGGSSLQFGQDSYAFSGAEDAEVIGQVSATGSDTISYTVVNAASHGVFALNADGTFTYTPQADFNGQDSVQVQASSGSKQVQVTLTFEVTPVNDVPVLTDSTFRVTSGETTTASLLVTDADGDQLTFTLIEGPENGELTLTSDGEATYTHNELEEVEGSFVVSFTDGVIGTPIEATIELKSAMVTNDDKRSYYYSQSSSHIGQAEAIQSELADDVARDAINIDLAASYYVAGFEVKAEEIIIGIDSLLTRAEAYKESAVALDARGLHEKAAELRAKAEESLTVYLGDKGLANISSSDVSFFLELNRDYLSADQLDESSQLMSRVKLYADSVREDEYTTTYGRFVTVVTDYAYDEVQSYHDDKSGTNLERARVAIQHLADLAERTGYQVYSKTGQVYYSLRVLYLSRVAELLYRIGDLEMARDYTAQTLALYGVVDYDVDFSYEVDAYSADTFDRYATALQSLSGLFEGLYPGERNLPLEKLATHTKSSSYLTKAENSVYSYRIANDMVAGMEVNVAVASAVDNFTGNGEDDYKELYQTLVETGYQDPLRQRAATTLFALGEIEKGLTLLNKASELLTSEAYVDTEGKSTSYVTGANGCHRLTQLQQDHGGDALAQAQACDQLVSSYYTSAGDFGTASAVTAHMHLMGIWSLVGDAAEVESAGVTMLTEATRQEDVEDRTEDQSSAAGYMLKYGASQASRDALTATLAGVAEMVASDDVEVLEEALARLADDILENGDADTGYFNRYGYVTQLKANVTSIDNYAEIYKATMGAIVPQVQALTEKALTLADNDIQNMMEDLVKMNFYAGQYGMVDQLINNDVNGEADKLSLKQAVAGYHALWDDFPGIDIASVDTDHDGKPNFFISGVTQEQIDTSGLVLDEDSDNDGIPDSEDSTPLGN